MTQPATVTTIQYRTQNIKPTFAFTVETNLLEFIGFFRVNPKTIGQYIRKRRIDEGISTRELADMVGCKTEIIWEWEKDEHIPGIKLIQKLNEILEIPPTLLKDAFERKYLVKEKIDLPFDKEVLRERLVECLNKAHEAGMRGRVEVFDEYKFGSLLRMFRYSLFMTSREFARALSVDHSTILDWEMGRNKPFGKMSRRIILQINKNFKSLQIGCC